MHAHASKYKSHEWLNSVITGSPLEGGQSHLPEMPLVYVSRCEHSDT